MALRSKKLPWLRTLKIGANQIDDVGIDYFSGAIFDRAAESLENLSITGNQIGDTGMTFGSWILTTTKSVTKG